MIEILHGVWNRINGFDCGISLKPVFDDVLNRLSSDPPETAKTSRSISGYTIFYASYTRNMFIHIQQYKQLKTEVQGDEKHFLNVGILNEADCRAGRSD